MLCHLCALVLEFRDGWAEGDEERMYSCWRLFLPHLKTANHTKYALEASRLQLQVKALLSLQLAHQVLLDHSVNTKGGPGETSLVTFTTNMSTADQAHNCIHGSELNRRIPTKGCPFDEHIASNLQAV